MINLMTLLLTKLIFHFLCCDIPCFFSYGALISKLVRFARVAFRVIDFNNRNNVLTAERRTQGYRYHQFHKVFIFFLTFFAMTPT